MQRILVTAAIVALLLGLTSTATAQDATTTTADGKLLLLLDSSGSMKESAGGQTKIDAAKAALKQVVQQLPDDSQVGVRVFGAKVFSAKDKGACTDTQNVVPVGSLDRQGITDAVESYKPYGETPIGNALKGAAKDLGSEGKRTIVLLSDGEPTCSPDPCKVARDLRAQGVDLTVNVVGLNVSGMARNALQCIADAGGGTYYDVDQPDELASSLVTTSVRAFREFTITGKTVVGGESSSEPTAVNPGQYTDTTLGAKRPRFYTVDVPAKGGIAVSATGRPEATGNIVDYFNIKLTTPDGELCDQGYEQRANVVRLRSIITAAAYYSPLSKNAKPECLTAKKLIASVETKTDEAFPYELGVTAVPEATNIADLPAGDEADLGLMKIVEPTGPRTPVVGGAGFADAPELKPGTYADSIRPGEELLYKVPVAWGQAPRISFRMEADAQADQVLSAIGTVALLRGFSPLREQLATNAKSPVTEVGSYNGSEARTVTNVQGPIRFRNIEPPSYTINPAAYAGDYYFALELSSEDGDRQNYAAPLTISVALDGAEAGVPKFASPPQGSASNNPSKQDSGSLPWLPIGIGAVLVALAGGAYTLRNRGPVSSK